MGSRAAAFALLALLTISSSAHAQTAPLVVIDSGRLAGVSLASLPHGGAFLGIPYAAQPVGGLRWRAPQLPPHWSGIRKAAAYGAACPQAPSPWLPEMLGRKAMATDEACLYLNVWTPKLAEDAKLPVLVWVHGGGNVEGSAEWPPLGETLARRGIVVVSLNYRLGVFGFFAYPTLAAESPQHVSGNYGQLDQLAALKWVERNIRHFGGDPQRVTVAGASSGSLDICNLLASPLSAGLLEGAILQSGVCVDSIFPTSQSAEKSDAEFVKDLGVKNGPHALAELRAMPAARLLKAAATDQHADLEPVVDGWFLREQPAATFARSAQLKVPVLTGSNENEMSIFASSLVGGTSYRPKTVAEYRQWLRGRFHTFADAVFAAYPASSDAEVRAVFTQMDTDLDFGFGARLLAIQTARAGQNAFLYHFTYMGVGEFAALGAFHSEESMFLSKKYWTRWIARPYDETLSEIIDGYWVRFVTTGNPNGAGLPPWPVYDPAKDVCQELGERVGPMPVRRVNRFGVFQERLDSRLRDAQPNP
jgi:para-nitrobenzyl esterase